MYGAADVVFAQDAFDAIYHVIVAVLAIEEEVHVASVAQRIDPFGFGMTCSKYGVYNPDAICGYM
jgi:hypothetical protein